MTGYLKFEKKKTCDEHLVRNTRGQILGQIGKGFDPHHPKKRMLFFPDAGISMGDEWFTHECLQQIADKLKEMEG